MDQSSFDWEQSNDNLLIHERIKNNKEKDHSENEQP